ncbi:MAG TPA: hypothetical protein VFN30_12275 [Chitinophagaceae bacterium]|nr:hypothetical protein [Chitinophagaceae bacterium]
MSNGQKIALVQLFSNGDCLFATTIARQLKNDHPGCELTWIVSSNCKNMLLNNPDIDVVEEVVIPGAAQNEEVFNRVVKETLEKKTAGIYAKVIVPQLLGTNMQYYDGTVCSSIYRSSGLNINVDTAPVLYLTEIEKEAAKQFALKYSLPGYKNVVLFECAPQTKQLNLTDEIILDYSLRILKEENTCVILSGPRSYNFDHPHIIDGNTLSIRETVALTHYCTLLLGCSSGISWAATSIAAKPLPMVQILAPDAYYFNPLSFTFKKWHKPTGGLIELVHFDNQKLETVFADIFHQGFEAAQEKHNQAVKPQFRLYRGIIHHFLKRGRLAEIATFVSVNLKENGFNISMLKYMLMGLILFPIQLILDQTKKN